MNAIVINLLWIAFMLYVINNFRKLKIKINRFKLFTSIILCITIVIFYFLKDYKTVMKLGIIGYIPYYFIVLKDLFALVLENKDRLSIKRNTWGSYLYFREKDRPGDWIADNKNDPRIATGNLFIDSLTLIFFIIQTPLLNESGYKISNMIISGSTFKLIC